MKFSYRNLEVLAVVPPCEYYPNAGKYLCCLTFMHSIMSGNSFPRRFNTQGSLSSSEFALQKFQLPLLSWPSLV